MSKLGWDKLRIFETHDESLRLRRIFDIQKFEHLLKTKTLYFSPASCFEDELEGHYTTLDHENWDVQLVNWGLGERELEMAREAKGVVAKNNQQATVISCWSSSNIITQKMWDEYTPLGSGQGIAVETTVGRVRKVLGDEFLIIPVRYIDFRKEVIPKEHSMQPYFYKQKNLFSWEEEVRLIGEMEIGKRIGSPREHPISLASFIDKVTVNPAMDNLFLKEVDNLVKKYSSQLKIQ